MRKLLFVQMLLWVLCTSTALADEKNYYVERRSYGTARETEPPRYVKQLDKSWLGDRLKKEGSKLDWLDIGIEHRERFEYRNNDYRYPDQTIEEPLLQRTRFYFAVKEILDPLRFTVEYQDSRRRNSQYEADDRDVNKHEPIQMYAELYFKETFGEERPLSMKYGRMAFEQIDRRLIARNEWRNTTNNFQGFRTTLGKKENDWGIDVLNLQPIDRRPEQYDVINDSQWLHGIIVDWRRWSEIVTLQPYYLQLRQDGGKISTASPESSRLDRLVHTVGLRGYGVFEDSGLDYDVNLIRQFGDNGSGNQSSYVYVVEGGYTAEHKWRPRFSSSVGVASGDKDPTDNDNERFERLFGFARPWSNNDYFQMENIVAPKVRVEFVPLGDLKIDLGYSWYYLQSSTDRWNNANLRDPSGQSGKDLGQEADIRIRFPVVEHLSANIGYVYFMAGHFTELQSPDRDDSSHFFYTELTFNPF